MPSGPAPPSPRPKAVQSDNPESIQWALNLGAQYVANELRYSFTTASQLILSPAQTEETPSAANTTNSSTFGYHSLPRLSSNNVSETDPYTTSFMQPPWIHPSMSADSTQYRAPMYVNVTAFVLAWLTVI